MQLVIIVKRKKRLKKKRLKRKAHVVEKKLNCSHYFFQAAKAGMHNGNEPVETMERVVDGERGVVDGHGHGDGDGNGNGGVGKERERIGERDNDRDRDNRDRDNRDRDRGATPEFMRFLNIEDETGGSGVSFDNLEAMLDSLHRAEHEFMSVKPELELKSGLDVKPEFTPLLSPMVQSINPTIQTNTGSTVSTGPSGSSVLTGPVQSVQSGLSPLSSPMLEFHRYTTLRKRVDTDDTQQTQQTTYKKPRTPSTTPQMAPRRPSSAITEDELTLPPRYRNSVLINPHHHKSATSSPVILPSSTTPVGTNILSQFHEQPQSDKKTSHKLAEQGRRNRMNIAIQDLDSLIPEEWKKDITVPSKATTVELGCRYIRYLLEKQK